MASIEIILSEPYRTEVANVVYPGNDVSNYAKRHEFTGPKFGDCKYVIKEGVLSVTCKAAEDADVIYYYPLHTIARIKEVK